MASEGTKFTEQSILNRSFDETNQLNMVESVEFDGVTFRKPVSGMVATKITESGNITYIAVAPIGTTQSDAKWQVKKIEVSGADTIITWAEGSAAFTNVATDLTSLNYS